MDARTLNNKDRLEILLAALDRTAPRLLGRQLDKLPEFHVAFELGCALIESGIDRRCLTFGPTINRKRPDLIVQCKTDDDCVPFLIELKTPHYYTKYSNEMGDYEINPQYIPSLCHAVIRDLQKLHHATMRARRFFILFDDSGQWVRRNRRMQDAEYVPYYSDLSALRSLGLSVRRPLNSTYTLTAGDIESALTMLEGEDAALAARNHKPSRCKRPKEPIQDLHITPRYWFETGEGQLLCAVEVDGKQ